MGNIIDQTTRRAFEDIRATLSTTGENSNLPQILARLGDLTYANSLLWIEAMLKTQEQWSRNAPGGKAITRTILMATVTTDIVTGYLSLRERARLWPGLVSEKDWELQNQRGAKRIMDTAASLGGALIKACQFASTRPDLLPKAYIAPLSTLQDRLPPRDWSTMEGVIAREIGRRPEDVFEMIEHEPVAAASIAQVHRARLRNGQEVALKIQYPEIADIVETDLTVLERIFNAVSSLIPSVRLQPVLDYLKGTLPLELDFAHEVGAMTKLRALLAYRTDVVVPEVVPELCTKRLIVMEFIEGIKITDREALVKAGIDPAQVARILNDLFADQMLHLKMLHADPHPGNVFVQPGPKIVLLDHGLTVELSDTLVHSLAEMVRSLVAGDFDGVRKALVEAGLQLDENVDISTLFQLVGVLLGDESTVGVVEVGSRLSKSFGSIPLNLLLVGRALAVLDGITKQLDPSLDTMEIVSQYT